MKTNYRKQSIAKINLFSIDKILGKENQIRTLWMSEIVRIYM